MIGKNKEFLNYFTFDQLISNNIHLGDCLKGRAWYEENFMFIEGSFNNHFIMNLNITVQNLRTSLFLIEHNVSRRLRIMLSIQNKLLFSRVRSECFFLVKYGCYYINTRWVGGVLTNFKTLSIKIFPFLLKLNLNDKRRIKRKVYKKWNRLLYLMGGLRGAKILPSLVFSSNLIINPWVFREAFLLLIPSVGLNDSDSPQSGFVTYNLPSNDDSYKSSLFFFLIYRNAFLVGRLKRKKKFLFFLNLSLIFIKNSNNIFLKNSFAILFYRNFFKKLLRRLVK
jgi:small subunit ribosomal protein S2